MKSFEVSTLADRMFEFTNAGDMQFNKVSLFQSKIVGVEKPNAERFGSIIVTVGGEHFPVVEKYEDVLAAIEGV